MYKNYLPFLFGGFVIILSALTSTKDPLVFLNLHAFMMVVGGTIAAAAISFRFDRIVTLTRVFVNRVVRGTTTDHLPLIKEIMKLSEAYRTHSPTMKIMIDEIKDPFFKEGMKVLTEGLFETDDMLRVMQTRTNAIYQRYFEEAVKFKTLGKFPPAFGLMGAVMGMISIMKDLGNSGGGATIGPAMALALVGTLYGIGFANMVIIPIGENLLESAKELKLKNTIIIEGIKLISMKKNPIIVAEELNSFLPVNQRLDWKTVVGYGSTNKVA